MKILFVITIVFVCLSALFLLISAIYSGKPIRRLLINALVGFVVIAVINMTSRFSGIVIHINPITVVGTGVFSVPAVIGFLLLNVILI